MPDPAITPELVAKHGLTPDEFLRIKEILDREPNFTELGIFSVMWSEHCSYKNSRLELRKFPTTGPRVLVKAGEENAGVIDIGDGWGVAFKMESHNHPSAVEPFQGAATGVGGILRDIFTMGARPVFLMNSLRFGDIRPGKPNAATNRRLLSGVVAGIAHYGNCIGVPTVGGEIYFDASYDGQPARQRLLPRHAPRQRHSPRRGYRRRQPGLLRRVTAPAAMAWPAPPSPRVISPRLRRKTAPPCKSAIPSSKSFCSRPASNFSNTPRPSSACRTWAQPGSPVQLARRPAAATAESRSISRSCRSASRA